MRKIIGFDVSSETLAYSIFEYEDNNIKYISSNYIKPQKTGTIIDRIANTRDAVKLIIEDTKPDIIAIEDIVQFMKNSSTAQTIITLASFNRMVGLVSFDYLNKSPELINIMTIRHCIRRQAELQELPKKEDLPQILEKLLKIQFPWEYNKKGKVKQENYDKSDAMSCAYCCIIKMEEERHDINKKRKNTNNNKRKTDKSI